MEIDLRELAGRDRYKLAIGSVIPRPIAWVSTRDEDGVRNLAPFSFFTIACYNPLILAVFPLRYKRDREVKDTVRNVLATGEAVVHVVTEQTVDQANASSAKLDHGVDEFDLAGLTAEPSKCVKPDRIAESPIAFECVLHRHVSLGEDEGGVDALFLEAVHLRIRDDLVDHFRVDHRELKPVARLAGAFYAKLGDDFELKRPD